MENYIFFDGFDSKGRYFFSKDYDEAKAFANLFDGDFSYAPLGYTVTI